MSKPPLDPLAGTDRLLIDGTNLLHRIRRGLAGGPPATASAGSAGTGLPAAALIGRLRGAVPATVGIELVLDGPPDPGMRNERVASGLIVRHSGRRTSDEVLLQIVDDAARALAGPGARRGDRRQRLDNILVVTDDRDLRIGLQARGARTAGSRWLLGRLDRQRIESASIGNRRPPPASTPPDRDADERRWSPGRGATTKRGNPKRGRPPMSQ
jgi:hypothetical protein